MDAKHLLLLVFGLIVLVKAVWGLAAPGSIRSVTALAVSWSLKVRCAVAFLALAAGVFTWGMILIHEPLSSRMLGFIALALAGAAAVWLDQQLVRAVGRFLVAGRSSWAIRLISLAAAALAIWMIWAAATGR